MQRLSSEGLNRGDVRRSGKAYQVWQLTTEYIATSYVHVLSTKNANGENYMESHRHANAGEIRPQPIIRGQNQAFF